jgi:hypothetical protein
MKVLKAKIKKTSRYYEMGLNQKGKSLWLSITGFNANGNNNFKLNAIKKIVKGFAQYQEIWISKDEILLKHIEDGQLTIELFSKEEFEQQKMNPRYFNQRRFEISTTNEKRYIHAPDLKTANSIAHEFGLDNYSIKEVKKLTKNEINNA